MSGEVAAWLIFGAALLLLALLPVAFWLGTRQVDRRLNARVHELENDVWEAEQRRTHGVTMRRHLDRKVKHQRRELAELRKQRDANVVAIKRFADDTRLLLRSKALKLHAGPIHDGNHPLDECDACLLYKTAERWCTEPWHRVVRDRGITTRRVVNESTGDQGGA
jgi:hypothetical protein